MISKKIYNYDQSYQTEYGYGYIEIPGLQEIRSILSIVSEVCEALNNVLRKEIQVSYKYLSVYNITFPKWVSREDVSFIVNCPYMLFLLL